MAAPKTKLVVNDIDVPRVDAMHQKLGYESRDAMIRAALGLLEIAAEKIDKDGRVVVGHGQSITIVKIW